MSDNGPAYLSRQLAKAYSVLKHRHIGTRLYTPRTNDKNDRFIQNACKE